LGAVVILLLKPTTDSLTQVAGKIKNRLNDVEVSFTEASKSKELRSAMATGHENSPLVEETEARGINLYYYQNDSLVHWTSNNVLPPANLLTIPVGTSAIKLRNGWYQIMRWQDTTSHEDLVGLLAIKYQYPFENKFLKNEFALGLGIPHNIEITEQKIQGSIPVKNLNGKVIFSLYPAGEEKADEVNLILLISQIILLLIICYYVQVLAAKLVKRNGFAAAFAFLLVAVFLGRGIMLWFNVPSEFNQLDLFSPKYYASSVLTGSLGDLIIDTLLLGWVILFWLGYKPKVELSDKYKQITAWFYLSVVFALSGLFTWIFRTLVMDSVISFEVYNILNLSAYSLLGIICLSSILILHFLIARETVFALRAGHIKTWQILAFCIVAAAIYCLFAIHSNFYQVTFFSALWTVFFVFTLSAILKTDGNFSTRNLILYVTLYSILSAYLIENLYERRERNQRKFFASRLVTDRDFVAEYMFGDISQRIDSDVVVKTFFNNPGISKKRELTARLSSLYLSGYFNKYDLKVYTYDQDGNSLRNRDTLSLNYFKHFLSADSLKTQTLHYVSDTAQNYSYLAFFNFYEDSVINGTLVLRLLPKIYYGQNVYPELLLGENITTMAENSRYNYAIYKHDKLIIQHGDFAYTYDWNKNYAFDDGPYKFIDEDDWEHIIYHFPNDMKVIVTERQEGLFEPVATFSYLFSFYFLAALIALLIERIFVANGRRQANMLDGFSLSFRTRINYSMLSMIIVSFVIIGFITISFFSRQYNNFYNDRLTRKGKVIHASLEYFVQQNETARENLATDPLNNELNFEVARLAELNEIDINLYDKEGNLVVASQPAVYDKGLVSKKMNPDAFFELAETKVAQLVAHEAIGGLSYQAIYAPVRNIQGEAIAYVGIPYFEQSKNISDDVSSFLVALMNVYVFLLICAAILAYFISNSITRPLTIISEKLRILNLNKKNEPIEWKSRDEIGVLIGEYNKMITELEQSAQKLARGERESAWREMAKQIAHEIKNPLTPMKLSIQYLQRAIDAGDPNIAELAKKVTRTLDEQIENLSSIATAFASFAKMPKANNEIINLNELLKSIAELFNREGNAKAAFDSESLSPFVFADKNQLVSVFNNLVKNAIQSIPENRTGFVDIRVAEENDWVVVSVKDNGSGISKGLYEKVFVPNFTTKSSGTGLGLAISRQIIDGAGGSIWFESVESEGSTFFVKLKKSNSV
jgi:signal transduction histidine kinase